jgi:hypothetical protein
MSMLRVNSGTANEDCNHSASYASILGHPPRVAIMFAVSKTPDIAAYVWAPFAPSESEAGFRPANGGQVATSDDSGPEANVITRLLKIELDPAKPGCCNATIAVQ